MVDAMRKGDWQAAQQEAEKLGEQLEQGELDESAKKELARQLKQIQEKSAEASAARAQAMDQLKQQVAQQQQQGDLERAGQSQQKLEQMQAQQQQASKLNQLAQLAGECQQRMKEGDKAGAAKALNAMTQQMQQMQLAQAEGKMLDESLEQMQMAKSAMACQQCQGQGCEACQGAGSAPRKGQGPGIGVGSGPGSRPGAMDNVKYQDQRVRQKPGPGSAVVVGEAAGPNLRLRVSEAVQEEMAAQSREPADPQVLEQLPKSRREHAQEYFNLLREGR
jgi:hypothetical protein